MSTNFPTSLDTSTTIPAEGASTPLATNHVTAHQNIQDAIEAIEAKVGADSSVVTTSHDYKLSEVTSTDKAVGKTASQTLTNKTLGSGTAISLGSDAEGDTYYRNSSGVLVRLARGTDNYILKMNGNVPNWEAESVTSNASTTTAGIVELATDSEVTSGTSTGGSGAPLVVTPDGLASSTPVFNGSGLTNIPRWLTSGAPATTTTNTTATVLTYSLTGGTLSTNKGVRIRVAVQVAVTASNGSAVYTVQYGGSTIGSFGYNGNSGTPTVTAVSVIDITLLGSGATGTQRANAICTTSITSGSGGITSGAEAQINSLSIDSTANQNITISCTSNSSAVTGTLLDYFIEKIV